MKYGFGIDLGGTTVKLAFFREDGEMLDKWEIPTDKTQGGSRILPDIAAAVNGYIKQHHIAHRDLLGLGIGVPGPVRPDGTVNGCVNLGWGNVRVEKELEALTGLPVKAGNDASVAALGECWKGGGAGCQNMIFATLGTGVGGGIVVDGKVVHGTFGAGGEIGHITLVPGETEACNCGRRGCAEQYCSATGIVRLAKKALETGESTLSGKEDLTCKDLFDAAQAGDALANRVLEQVYDLLGQLFATLACVTDPQIIVLGGGVSKAGQVLLDGVGRAYGKHCFHATGKTRFALATLGNDAGAYGAFRLVLRGQTMEKAAFFKFSYGLFVLTARQDGKDNGCIINTAGQITEDPATIQIAVNKNNLTHDMVLATGEFNLSVLSEDAVFWIFQHYGFQSGRDVDKFANLPEVRTANGIRYVGGCTNAVICAKVISTVDCGSHTLFVAQVTDAKVLSNDPSMTYQYYFDNVKPKPAKAEGKWVCKICNYVYEGDQLPEDFVCPLCKHGPEAFEKQ